MNKFKYLKISNTKKIRYFTNYYKKNLYIVFLHGFMSDLEGDKPKQGEINSQRLYLEPEGLNTKKELPTVPKESFKKGVYY